MKGKKFIAVISIVCILAVILCIPAFATVTESSGDGYALYNGVKFPNIDSVWTDKITNPYACIMENSSHIGFPNIYLLLFDAPFTYGKDGSGNHFQVYGNVSFYDLTSDSWIYNSQYSVSGSYFAGDALWTSVDLISSNSSHNDVFASNPISLDGYNIIEWDGDTMGLQKVSGDDAYYIAIVDELAVDAFTVMQLSYSETPVVINGFHLVETLGWYVDPPASPYTFSGGAEINDYDIYDVAALKFDDVDDTGYTSLIAYRTVEDPPGEGGDTPDDPQPPFGAIEI